MSEYPGPITIPAMPHTYCNGHRVYYSVSPGTDGLPLVLIHGAGNNRYSWPARMRRDPSRPVIAVDLPGHGRSDGPPAQRLAEYVRPVLAVLDGLNYPQAVMVDHSMGGAIAQLVALQHPARVAGLVLIGTGLTLPVAQQILAGVAQDFESFAPRLVGWCFRRDAPRKLRRPALERFRKLPPETVLADYRACNEFDTRNTITAWKGPTLIICGEADIMTPVDRSHELAAVLPQARLTLVPQAGHMVMVEQAAEVADLINNFVAGLESERGNT
ncbi:MAG: alpha/beta fold hydrolase [Anaerolineales bacterium]